MNLKDFLSQRDNPPELYWSVIIEDSATLSGIWHIEGETSVVDGIGSQSSYFNKEELISAVDATLSATMQKLSDDSVEPKKTVFGVPSSWVSGGEIKDEHLADIKQICEELTLTPVGFVVLPEAIAHLYKADEGVPLSGIVVGLGSNNLEVSVFKLGNLVGSANVARSVSLSEDITEGLSRFEGASPLPTRFIVYDGKEGELDDAKEELMKASWDDNEKIKFLHTPKAEILSTERKILAVSLAGASEMGDVSKVSMREFTPIGPEVENVVPVTPEESVHDLGFAINEDVSNEPEEVKAVYVPPPPVVKKNVFHDLPKPKMPKMPTMPSIPKFNFSIAPMFIVAIVILIGIALGFYYLPKADVTIFVSPKSYQGSLDLAFDKNNSQVLTSKVSGNKTKSTTGKKVVGDKAKGSVEIANGNSSSLKLAVGTMLTSSSGLKFVTTQEASISGQLLPGSPGTATVSVNANDIGSQYNLSKGEIFTVGNYSKALVAATSQADFSGGSSREISAVNKDDRDSLEKDLKDELSSQIDDDLSQKIDSDKILITDFVSEDVTNENFDHKVGDEADTLKLTLEVTANAIAVDKQKLFDYTSEKLKDVLPTGFVLRNDQINYKFKFKDNSGDTYNYSADVTANFLPGINNDEITKKISGKSVDAAKKYLNTLSGFRGAQVTFNNSLFSNFKLMPFISKNITIEIAAEK